jgi:hypothetical protein
MFDPAYYGIDADNLKTGTTICVKNVVATISAIWTFTSNPVFNAEAISDAALSSNIPKKNAANTFSALQTLSAGIDLQKTQALGFIAEKLGSLPGGTSADIGRVVYCTGDNKYYGWNGTSWVELSYVGGYTGGAIRSYTGGGLVDDADSQKLWFKTEGASPTVKVTLKGEPYPKRFYLELPYHTHAFTGTAHVHPITDPNHYHAVVLGSHGHGTQQYALDTHTHGLSGNTGNCSQHHHDLDLSSGAQSVTHTHLVSGSTEEKKIQDTEDNLTSLSMSFQSGNASVGHTHAITGETVLAGIHNHSISLTSGAPSASAAVASQDLGSKNSDSKATGITIQDQTAGGNNAYAGVNIGGTLASVQKLYGKSLVVKIDGTDVTSNVLSATGWGAIGDGTGGHAFHTAGTGEMNASAWKSYSAGFHTIEIVEGQAGYGCSLLIHIETS